MNKYAMILSDSTVRGICVWDGIKPWNPPPEIDSVIELMPDETCGPGWQYHSGQSPRFTPPEN